MAIVKVEWVREDHVKEYFRDEDVIKSILTAPEFRAPTVIFNTDNTVIIDKSSQARSVTGVCIFKRPAELSIEQFYDSLDDHLTRFSALPSVEDKILKGVMCSPVIESESGS
ncbi:hypothetical protein C8R46DRAFT_1036188 [Mycena filopes]|nr:hypothetical protein C8R46DRAFT_1036188 [Mycena filopes]